uniref:ATP-grasp domain-containing protein n=1 Tax=viral metagenome TaxID=1070528 RepID=A0A6C0HN70_9ZZZZ
MKKHNTKTAKHTPHKSHTPHTYFVISECYNAKYNDLLTSQLKYYLKTYNLIEYKKIHELDMKQLKPNNLKTNCSKQLSITKTTKLPPYIKNQHFDFIWLNPIENSKDHRFYALRANLINMLNQDRMSLIDNKSVIYQHMHTYCPDIATKHLARTFYINEHKQYKFTPDIITETSHSTPQHYILRPVDSFAGRDIFYISNEKELNKAIAFYNSHKNYRGVTYANNVIASEYIINPMLFKGYKFHMRVYYLITYINNTFASFMLDMGKIIHAGKPYTTTKPFTKIVHDTHLDNSGDYFWPDNFTGELKNIYPDILEQTKNILKCVSNIISHSDFKQQWLYNEHTNGFLIMGVDIMVDTTGRVFLIEVNNKAGFNCNEYKNKLKLEKIIFKWINDIVLEPYYTNNLDLAMQHSTYIKLV